MKLNAVVGCYPQSFFCDVAYSNLLLSLYFEQSQILETKLKKIIIMPIWETFIGKLSFGKLSLGKFS